MMCQGKPSTHTCRTESYRKHSHPNKATTVTASCTWHLTTCFFVILNLNTQNLLYLLCLYKKERVRRTDCEYHSAYAYAHDGLSSSTGIYRTVSIYSSLTSEVYLDALQNKFIPSHVINVWHTLLVKCLEWRCSETGFLMPTAELLFGLASYHLHPQEYFLQKLSKMCLLLSLVKILWATYKRICSLSVEILCTILQHFRIQIQLLISQRGHGATCKVWISHV